MTPTPSRSISLQARNGLALQARNGLGFWVGGVFLVWPATAWLSRVRLLVFAGLLAFGILAAAPALIGHGPGDSSSQPKPTST